MPAFRRPGGSRPLQSRPIRLFLIGMIAVPLISLVALYAFSAFLTVPKAISDHNYTSSTSAQSTPEAVALSQDLPAERAATYIWLASGRKSSKAPLLAV